MALRTRGNSWVSEKRHKGQHHRVTIGPKSAITKTRAKEIDHEWVAEFIAGGFQKTKEIPFLQAGENYLAYFASLVIQREALGVNGRSPKTLKGYESNFTALKRFFSGKNLSEISPFDFRRYRSSRKDFPISFNRELSFFSACFNFAKREGKVRGCENPVLGQKLKFREVKRTRSLTEQESSMFFSELCSHAWLPFAIEQYCGLRLTSQVLFLKHDDLKISIDAQTGERLGSLEGQAVYSKNKRSNSVAVPPWMLERLEDLILASDPRVKKKGWFFHHESGKRAGQRRKVMRVAFTGAVERVQRKYGDHLLQDFHIHDLRHTFATWSHAHGADALTLKEMGGWQSLEMVDRYVNPTQEKAREIINALPAPGRIAEKERTDQRTKGNLQDSEFLEVV